LGSEDTKITTLKSGTTIVGLRTNDFVILASDMQSTLGYIASDLETQKVFPITSNVALGLAGSLGDASQMIRILKMHSSIYENERNKKMSTKALITLTANIFNANRYYPYEAFFIFGGFIDKPELYSVDPLGGVSTEKKYTATGSGMTFAMGVLDNKYKDKMTKEEAISLVCDAIRSSKKRDIHSGGDKTDIYIIDKKGIENIKKE
jgi:proteasome beta subunit